MPYPTTFTWPLIPETPATGGAPPTFGPFPPGVPTGEDARKKQFERGIKFANVPGGKSENVVHGGARVYHVNTVANILQETSDKRDLSGVVKFRHRSRLSDTPDSILHIDVRSSDRFANPVFPFTGQYPPGYEFVTIDNGFWNTQSPVTHLRSRYMGARILDNRILVAGGLGEGLTPLSGTMVFSTGTNAWTPLPDMPGPKSWGAGALLSNGDFLVLGGSGSVTSEMTASYRYLTASNSWLVITGTICSRQEFQMVTLPNGFVVAAGGTGLSGSGLVPFTGSELFNPNTNRWYANSGVMPPIPLYPYDREGYQFTLLEDSSILLTGGRDPRDRQNTAHVLRFFPPDITIPGSTGSWRVEPSMSFARSGHRAIRLDDGKVLICGGAGGIQANLQSFLPMFLAGQHGSRDAIAEVELYDPDDGSVRSIGQMQTARAFFGIALLPLDAAEGRVVVCGGDDDGTIISGTEICDVETFSWKRVTSLQTPIYEHELYPLNNPLSQSPYRLIAPSGRVTGSANFHSSSQVYQTDG